MKTPPLPTQNETVEPPRSRQLFIFGIIAAASLLFSLKGVFAKLAYAYGSDPIEVLTLRMGFALPFFATTWFLIERREGGFFKRSRLKDTAHFALLGLLGYYASSMLDFIGLQYVSAGLERIILYSYPTIVLLLSAFIFHQKIERRLYAACILTWLGVAFSFLGEISLTNVPSTLFFGGGLIFLCALTYALFIIFSGQLLKRVSPQRFTSGAMTFSSLFMLSHFSATRDFSSLFSLPPEIIAIGLFLGIGGTVIPGYLTGYGLKHAGASRFAIISSIGPVTTLFAASYVLGEIPDTLHWLGLGMTIAGGLTVALKEKTRSP